MEFTGTLDKVHLANDTGKWKTYDLAFDTGENHRVLVPNDANVNLDNYKGKDVKIYQKGSNFFLAYKELLGNVGNNGSSGGFKKGSNYKKGGGGSARDDYWTQKYYYEVDEKDPQMALRSLFIQCANFYQGALPFFADPPTNTIEADAIIDDAWAKARELFIKMSRDTRKDEDE